jgi:cardiolipin synthase
LLWFCASCCARTASPASRIAWILVVLAVPVLGISVYLLLGEVNIGRRRARSHACRIGRDAVAEQHRGCPRNAVESECSRTPIGICFGSAIPISELEPVGGNSGRLLADSNATIDSMVADIDAARDQVHLLFYIWLPDNNGCKNRLGTEARGRTRRHLPAPWRMTWARIR